MRGKGERRMKKALALLVVAIIVCQGFAVLTPTVRAETSTGSVPEVVCVPFHGKWLGVPHDAWIGKEIVLKGTAHDADGDSTLAAYKWDFGDGYSTDWIGGVNPYVIEAKHTYTGTMADGTPYEVGKYFTAWLYVRDVDGLVGQDSYFVAIRAKTLDVEVNVAIDDGLWWLQKQASRYTSGGIDYARWPPYYGYYTSATAESVLAFEIQGHQPIGDPDENPYVETVQRGLNYVFTQTRIVDISAWGPGTGSPYGDPDTNGNDKGIGISSGQEVYELGMVMMAIAASGDPDLTANTGPTGVVGRTYKDILTDMVDLCAWGQNDYGGARGGWRYGWNYGSSDNSVSQWPMMALEAAETNWGIVAPGFVKTELNTYWLTYSQRADGGFGYTGPDTANIARTGTGIIGLNYVGLPADNPRITKAVNWLGTHWSEFGNYYGMYAVMKGMRTAHPEITMVGTHDWYAEYARYLVDHQQADDGWPDYYGRVLATDWAILILTPTVTQPGPVADAGPDVNNFPPTIPLEFDASGSYHMDPAKSIVLYEWDFESDGTWDYSGTDLEVKHAYPAYYYVPYFSQRDPAWANELLGGDGPTISSAGCALTSAAMVMVYYGVDTDPKRLNELIGRTGYDADYNIYWSVVEEKCHTDQNQIKYEGKIEPYSSEEVDNQLDAGRPPIVDVGGHFVVVTKREGDTYYINDPWDKDIKTLDHYPTRTGLRIFSGKPNTIDWDATAKDYTTTLRVTDNSDPPFQDTDTCVVHITAPPWKPVADPDGPYEGYEGVSIQLDGSKSYDPESKMYTEGHPWYETITAYEWDLDNDGQFDDSTEVNPSYTWTTKGAYSVGLRVTDSQPSGPGGTVGSLDVDTKYTTVVISAATHKVAYITIVYPDTPQEEIDDHSLDDIKDRAKLVERYYSQQSYGKVAIKSDFIFEDWETMENRLEDYLIPPPSGWDHPSNGIEAELWRPVANDAVELAGIDEDDYDAIVIIQPEPMRPFTFREWLFWIGKEIIVHWEENHGTIAHELGHAIFKFGDYYSESWHWTSGDVKDWGLMGTGSLWNPPAPITCWNKIQTGWLKEKHVLQSQIPGEFKVGLLQGLKANDEVIVYSANRFEGRFPPDGVEQDPSRFESWVLKEKKGIVIYEKDWLGKIYVIPHDNDDFTTVTLLPGETYYDFWGEADYTAVEKDSELYIRIEPHPIWETIVVALRSVEFEIPELSMFSADLYDTSLDFDLHVFTTEGEHIGMNYEHDEYEIEAYGAATSGNIPGAGPEWIAFPSDSEIAYLAMDPTPAREFAEESGLTISDIQVTFQIRYYDSDGNAWESELVTTSAGLEEPTIMRYAIIQNPDGTYTPVLDNTPPMLTVEVPQEGAALQDGVTLKAYAKDENGVSSVTFSIREPNGEQGTPIAPAYEYMPASPTTNDRWILPFDTTQIPDGYYLAYAEATDIAGNIASGVISFSIRNWAPIELLPASESNKAGRTMPVKFSLRIDEDVDPAQPFVYNEELTIIIYSIDNPTNILQTSTYGDTARDYRIDLVGELYITNFQTLKTPKTYVVEIYRKGMLIGTFEFSTVK